MRRIDPGVFALTIHSLLRCIVAEISRWLEAVLADIDEAAVDVIVVGGDLAWGAPPSPTIERLMKLGDTARFILGNADVAHVREFDLQSDPIANRRAREQRDLLADMSATLTLTIDDVGPTLFCHGSPRNENERITTATPDARLRELVDGVEESLIVCGHTHRQFDRTITCPRTSRDASSSVCSNPPTRTR